MSRASYAMPGTDVAYGATRWQSVRKGITDIDDSKPQLCSVLRYGNGPSRIIQRLLRVVSGTDPAYGAMRCPVLSSPMR
eukprot:1015628-Rhodomonas_salina.1